MLARNTENDSAPRELIYAAGPITGDRRQILTASIFTNKTHYTSDGQAGGICSRLPSLIWRNTSPHVASLPYGSELRAKISHNVTPNAHTSLFSEYQKSF